MSWVTVIWSMVAAACLTMAGLHWMVWSKQRTQWANLLFAVTATSTAIFVATEFWIMRAETPPDIGTATRWAHVPIWLVLLGLVAFVKRYLRAGRAWLAWSFVGLRTLSLLLNFLTGQNLNYREISAVGRIPFLGEPVSVAIGLPNPWMLVGQLSSLALILFALDASVTVWRRGDRRKALLVGGSVVFFVLGGQIQSMLVFWGVVQMPIIVSWFYLGIVIAMGYELSHDVLRAAELGRELRESEERMELAAGAAELGLWTWDIPRDEIWATDEARALFGFTDSEPINFDRLLQTVHPDDRHTMNEALAKSMNADGEYESEHQVMSPDHTVRWIASRGRVEFNGDGKPIRLRGVSVNVSKRKQIEEATNRLAAIVETSDDAIFSKNLDGMITSWNAGAEKTFGYAANEIVGQDYSILFPLDLKREVREILERASRDESVDHLETMHVSKEGIRIDVSLTLSPIKNERRMNVGTSIIARDITARKKAEAEALEQRAELAHLSRVTMLGELSGSLAHELNQPLGAILRNTEAAELFLQEPSPDLEELRAILADIRSDDQRAGAVIDRMRSLLKRRKVEHNLLDLSGLVSEVVNLVRPDAGSRKVQLALEAVSSIPLVRGDRVQLQQVLLNLLLNAMDAVDECAPDRRRVTVRIEPSDALVQVTVSDTGHGIPPDKFPRLFEPFFTTKADGMGMGLPISRRIMEAHLGTIRAENGSAAGASFHFTLPLAKGASAS